MVSQQRWADFLEPFAQSAPSKLNITTEQRAIAILIMLPGSAPAMFIKKQFLFAAAILICHAIIQSVKQEIMQYSLRGLAVSC